MVGAKIDIVSHLISTHHNPSEWTIESQLMNIWEHLIKNKICLWTGYVYSTISLFRFIYTGLTKPKTHK